MNSTAPTTVTTTLRAEGFSCPSCVSKIEKSVGRLAGVESVKVHFSTSKIDVTHDPATAPVDDIVAAIAKVGYTARPSVF